MVWVFNSGHSQIQVEIAMSEYLLLQISTWTQVAAFLLTVIDQSFRHAVVQQ